MWICDPQWRKCSEMQNKMCKRMVAGRACKIIRHWLHSYGLSPMWIMKCKFYLLHSIYTFPNGFIWMILWTCLWQRYIHIIFTSSYLKFLKFSTNLLTYKTVLCCSYAKLYRYLYWVNWVSSWSTINNYFLVFWLFSVFLV